MSSSKRSLFIIGGVAAFLQLITILGYAIILAILGPKFASAEEFFSIYQESPLESFLRGDFFLQVLIGLYLGTFPALYLPGDPLHDLDSVRHLRHRIHIFSTAFRCTICDCCK